MSVQRIEKIEQIIINDPESPTGLTSVGFNTYYTNCIYVYSQIFFHSREIASVDKGIHNKTTKYGLPTY